MNPPIQHNAAREDATESNSASEARGAISVSELMARTKLALDRAIPLLWVGGEVSGFKRAASGHCYFDLKDSSAQMSCVIYRNRSALIGFDIRDGAHIEVRVRPSIYEPRGSLQFTVEQARQAGLGRLYEAFLALKAKLTSEGVFDPCRKRALPTEPTCIGLITSTKAAALADMLRVLRDRWPRAKLIVYPASVQGVNAPRELLAALGAANKRNECDTLIIGRGGGSIEDLWAFNDESLVRAVAASSIPIVSAIGHETDFTLCDFAADLRAPTPSAAAAAVTPDRRHALARGLSAGDSLQRAMQSYIERLEQRIDRAADAVSSTSSLIAPWRERLERLSARINRAGDSLVPPRRTQWMQLSHRMSRNAKFASDQRGELTALAQRLAHASAITGGARSAALQRLHTALEALSPERVLERGFSILLDAQGNTIADPSQTRIGERIRARTRGGDISAQVIGLDSQTTKSQ
ncbi:MAG: exodeoxyribonuclease VII large subunit [Betaproteobacteria bacterium]|nr:MAG: exodeoxyribonuclease VII large subunit [Betaproteobacteria bacterium]TAG48142.1 MAG: exodeoxyribonuclease VII large subunit [Betaproteobacteria bacterium]